VMGRALASGPSTLVLVSPTAGVDIASKATLFETIERSEAAILLVSDELDELAMCDRVLVMLDGRVVRELGPQRSDGDLVAAMEGVGA
jgi:simple sugar transport system ATP-binding protein